MKVEILPTHRLHHQNYPYLCEFIIFLKFMRYRIMYNFMRYCTINDILVQKNRMSTYGEICQLSSLEGLIYS